MSCAWQEDLIIIAGNDWPPAAWQFLISENPDELFSLEASEFYLSVKWPTGSIERNTVDHPGELYIDQERSIVVWNYSLAMSRQMPQGRIATYELERRTDVVDGPSDVQQTLIAGRIVVSGGINVD